jgi:prepilin-type N-terminal cleavage/methylation domain-containing protein
LSTAFCVRHLFLCLTQKNIGNIFLRALSIEFINIRSINSMENTQMHKKTQLGMTLIELLVVMTITGIVVTGLFSIFQAHHIIALKQEETTLMQQELLAATTQIADDLRMCGYSATGAPGFGFIHKPATGSPDYGRGTNETSVYCTLDWTGDGTLNENGIGSSSEHIAYRLNVANNGSPKPQTDNVLRKYDTGAVHWQPASTNIEALRFAYFDADGNPIADPGANTNSIRIVSIELTAAPSENRSNLGIGNRTMRTLVLCRNITR